MKKNKESNDYFEKHELPDIAILMAAYNEDKVIDEKIASVFQTNYPVSKIHFYIGSDASTDATDAIIEKWRAKYPQINLVRFGGRTGKSGIINKLSDLAHQEIYILTDANVLFKENTIYNLVRHFKMQNVGQVCANIIKVSGSNKGISSQEKSYLALENAIKHQEYLRWGIVMGAEGGCYAIRKSNFSKVPPKFFMDDFYITLNVIEQNKNIVFDTEAICHEDVSTLSIEEYKRKVRISIGNFQNLKRYKALLIPKGNGVTYAFLSHKILRWITPFLLIICLLLSFKLMFHSLLFKWLFLAQCLGFLSPLISWLTNIKIPVFNYISHFYLMNLALLHGFLKYMKGIKSNVWEPTKREVN